MTWTHIDSARDGDDVLDLYEKNGVLMIRINGLELMNGLYHASEDFLGALAAASCEGADPRILIGGLGLGFTLASLHAALDGRGHITVAEISPAVIAWHGRFGPARADDDIEIMADDILARAERDRRFDVIVLDVDNGPLALTARNASLYTQGGLTRFGQCLTPDGHLLLWSGFADECFERLAEGAGYHVALVALPWTVKPQERHYVYLLSKRAPNASASGKIPALLARHGAGFAPTG